MELKQSHDRDRDVKVEILELMEVCFIFDRQQDSANGLMCLEIFGTELQIYFLP
jgi:hypothetical protein